LKKVFKILLYSVFAIILIFSIAGVVSKDTIKIPEDFEGEYIDISGEIIRYNQVGNGEDLLLIHGLPGSLEDWEPIVIGLSSKFRVTSYDRPGHGYSSAKNIAYNLAHNADIVLGLINELKLKSVIVVGHSYGGSILMELAVRNPQEIKAYISVAGATNLVENIDPIYSIIKIPIIGRGFVATTSWLIGPTMIEDGVNQAFHPNEQIIPDGYIDSRMIIWLQTKVAISTAREELNINSDLNRIIPEYGNISKKFIIIHGENDLLVPKDDSVKLHKTIRNSKLVILSDTGHQVQYERPEMLIRTIEETVDN